MIVDESWYWIYSPAWFLCFIITNKYRVPYQPIQRDERAVDPIPTSCGLNHLKGKWWYMSVVKRGNGKSPINGSLNGTVRNLFVNMTDFKLPRIITLEGKLPHKPLGGFMCCIRHTRDDQHLDQPLVSGQGQSCLEPCSKRRAGQPAYKLVYKTIELLDASSTNANLLK